MGLTDEQVERVRRLLNDEWETDDDFRALLDAISQPEELHQVAAQFNWDGGCAELRAFIEHPACDQGTALLVFWHGAPGYHYRYEARSVVPPGERETYDLLKRIEEKYLTGGFRYQRIRVDPRALNGQDMTTRYKEEAGIRRVPLELLAASPGRELALLPIEC